MGWNFLGIPNPRDFVSWARSKNPREFEIPEMGIFKPGDFYPGYKDFQKFWGFSSRGFLGDGDFFPGMGYLIKKQFLSFPISMRRKTWTKKHSLGKNIFNIGRMCGFLGRKNDAYLLSIHLGIVPNYSEAIKNI